LKLSVTCCNYLQAIEKNEKAHEAIRLAGIGRLKAGRWRGLRGQECPRHTFVWQDFFLLFRYDN